MHNFRDLRIWRDARQFAKKIYIETRLFPKEELCGLTSQMRRAAVSIPSNIAEGCGRESNKSILQFLNFALSSAFELETQLLIAADLELIRGHEAEKLIQELQGIQRGIHFFKQNLRQ